MPHPPHVSTADGSVAGFPEPSEVGRLNDEVEHLRTEVARLRDQLEVWQDRATRSWEEDLSAAVGASGFGDQAEIAAIHASLSWKVTRPLRAVRAMQLRAGGRL